MSSRRNLLLLRPAENSPFANVGGSQTSVAGTAVSTPYSQASVPSSYEYDEDFTSDDDDDDSEAMSVRTAGNSMGHSIAGGRPKEMSVQCFFKATIRGKMHNFFLKLG